MTRFTNVLIFGALAAHSNAVKVNQASLAGNTGFSLAETEVESVHQHSCDYSHKRLWNGPANFNAILREEHPDDFAFQDAGFPKEDMIKWDDEEQHS